MRDYVVTAGALRWNWTKQLLCVLDGWDDSVDVEPVLTTAGGRDGSTAAGRWRAKEKYLTLDGSAECVTVEELQGLRSQILATFPLAGLVEVTMATGDGDRTMWLRRFAAADISISGWVLTHAIPLVAPDPYKYGLPLEGAAGVFTGGVAYRTYSAAFARSYAQAGSRTYVTEAIGGGLADAVAAFSPGTVESFRVTVAVEGPLELGDWWLVNDATGDVLTVDLGLAAGQVLTVDGAAQTADVDGAPVEALLGGDWLRLVPGENTFRLMSSTSGAARMTVTARPAYE